MDEKKYISKIVKGSDTLYVKDTEARESITTINTNITNLQTSVTGGMHYIGETSTVLTDGATTSTLTAKSENSLSKLTGFEAGDIVIYGELEFVWNGAMWHEFGSTGSLKALAFADSATGTVPPQSAAVTFTGGSTGDFVTGFSQNPVAPSFIEGAFTPASLASGFYNVGTAPSFTEGTFSAGSLPSLGAATIGNFNTDAEKSTYSEAAETLTLSAATTAAAVTAQGEFSAGTLPSKTADTFSAGTVTTLDLTKFNGGSKDADTWSAGTVPTLATSSAVTSIGSGSAAVESKTVTVSVSA